MLGSLMAKRKNDFKKMKHRHRLNILSYFLATEGAHKAEAC